MSDDQPRHEAARRRPGQMHPGPSGLPAPGRCLVIGVLNVTPDSFSDGGTWFDRDAAIRRGLELAGQGADLVDVGGESTRPGAQRVPASEERSRVLPVIAALAAAGVRVSVDTMRAQVAAAALDAGASLVNDVSGGLADPYMPRLVAETRVPYVVVHWRGHSHDMNSRAIYEDVVREVRDELAKRIWTVTAEGVDPSMIVLDPGLGFSKQPGWQGPDAHNWELLTRLREVARIAAADARDLPEPGQQLPVVRVRPLPAGLLAEAEPGVQHDHRRVDAFGGHRVDPPGEFVMHFADHVLVDGAGLHVVAVPAPVHDDVGDARLRHQPGHVRVGEPAAHVVDQADSRLKRPFGDLGAHRVHADHHAGPDKLGDDWLDPAQFLLHRYPLRSRPGALAADVHDVGALGDQLKAVLDRGGGAIPLPAVREGVRR